MLSISILIPIINDINAAPSKATTPFPSKEKLSMHRNPQNIKLDNFDPISSRREEKIRLKFPEIFLPFLLLHGGNFSKFQGEEKCKCENFQFGMEARDVCGHLRRNCLRLAFLDIPRGQLNRADTFYITVLKSSFIEREIKWFGRVESINPRRQRFLLFRRNRVVRGHRMYANWTRANLEWTQSAGFHLITMPSRIPPRTTMWKQL